MTWILPLSGTFFKMPLPVTQYSQLTVLWFLSGMLDMKLMMEYINFDLSILNFKVFMTVTLHANLNIIKEAYKLFSFLWMFFCLCKQEANLEWLST